MRTEPERGEELREPGAVSVAALTRPLATATLAGFVAGVIAGGIGSRIAMRIVAMTAGGR